MVNLKSPVRKAKQSFENGVVRVLQKFGYPSAAGGMGGHSSAPEPPYERSISPKWIYEMRQKQALVNNAIEEKVNQTFRRGFAEWEKEYVAKCNECHEEFDTYEPFRQQLGEAGDDLEEQDFDFDKKRVCPECDEMCEFDAPDALEKKRAQKFVDEINERGRVDQFLDGDEQNSVGQTFLEVCKEVAWDIQSFDDGWMIFERDYILNNHGEIIDWDLTGVSRAPPELMRYSVDQEGNMGEKWWICPACRATDEHYHPQQDGQKCDSCGNQTYRAYAEQVEAPGGDAEEFFIRGEFTHASEYEPSKFYGLSPIITLWEECRTLEQMDKWYQTAYEQRRAPRGAMIIRSTNAESVRSWNTGQFEKLKDDPHHIPTFIDDTEGSGQPLTWQPLLEDPAQMQHMQMREWFLDRISAKYGVTAVFQKASPQNSGLSQSMEIIVSNRSAHRLKTVFEDSFIPAMLSQLQVEGWDLSIAEIEEEDENAEAERIGKELKNAQLAQQVGADVEWTTANDADIKAGILESPEQEGGMMGGMGGMGGEPEGGDGGGSPFDEVMAGQTGPEGGRPPEANTVGGEPASPDEPTQGNEIAYSDGAGTHNATYGGARGGVINIFDHIQSQMNDGNADMQKRLLSQAKVAYDSNFEHLGMNGDTIEEYAKDDGKSFSDLCEDHYGKWLKTNQGRGSTEYLYELMGGNPQ